MRYKNNILATQNSHPDKLSSHPSVVAILKDRQDENALCVADDLQVAEQQVTVEPPVACKRRV